MLKILSFFAKKGGVGKTTLTFNFAGFLAKLGYRVLMIDADHQASLSQVILGSEDVERLPKSNTVAALFDEVHDPDPEAVIHKTNSENIWLAPANDLLQPHALPQPKNCGDMQFAFREFIGEVSSSFDYVVFDTPPDCANLLSWNCLMASNYMLSPIELEPMSTQSIAGVIRKHDEACTGGNANLHSLGYLINMRKKRSALHEGYEKKIRQLYGSQVFQSVIYDWVSIAEAPHKQQHIFDYAPASESAKVIEKVFEELMGNISSLSQGRAA